MRAGNTTVRMGGVGKSVFLGDSGKVNFPIDIAKESINLKKITDEKFVAKTSDGNWIPVVFKAITAYDNSTPSVTVSTTDCTQFDPTDDDITASWADSKKVCYWDTSSGKVECNGATGAVTVVSVATGTGVITLNETFSADPATTDFLMIGGFGDGEYITDLALWVDGVDYNNFYEEEDLVRNVYQDGNIDYDKMSSENQAFITALKGTITPSTLVLNNRFTIHER